MSRVGSWPRIALATAVLAFSAAIVLYAIPPGDIARALGRFNPWFLPVVIVLARVYFGIQGLRWWFLLRGAGIRISLWRAQLLTLAGQLAAFLPLGQYAKALMAAGVTSTHLGTITATVVVMEATYTLVLLAVAVPGSLSHPESLTVLLSSLATTTAAVAVLALPRAYRAVRTMLERLPWIRRAVPMLDDLHAALAELLFLPGTLFGTSLTVAYSLAYVLMLWLVAQGVSPGSLSWENAAFVAAVSRFAGTATSLPGGLGAYEASMVALLVLVGVPTGVAAATTILFTLADRAVGGMLGIGPYFILQRRRMPRT